MADYPMKPKFDIYETAILFEYLKEKEMIKNYPVETLSKMIHYLTGHSENTIRTKAFSQVGFLKDGRTALKKGSAPVLQVRELLPEIIDDIDKRNNLR